MSEPITYVGIDAHNVRLGRNDRLAGVRRNGSAPVGASWAVMTQALSRATETLASVDVAGDDDGLELTAELLGTPRRLMPMI